MRWQGNYDWGREKPNFGWWPLGGVPSYGWGEDQFRIFGNDTRWLVRYPMDVYNGAEAIDDTGFSMTPEVPYIFKLQVETLADDTSIYRMKVWEQGTTEPAEWLLEGYGIEPDFSTGTQGGLTEGSLGLITYYVDASFGNVSVRPVPPSLNVLPLIDQLRLQALQAQVESGDVNNVRPQRPESLDDEEAARP
jgi:hypothetical protein